MLRAPIRCAVLCLGWLCASCSAQRTVPIEQGSVRQALQQYLPLHADAPDDPALFDSTFPFDSVFSPTVSDPLWLVPSALMPEGVVPQQSNNNVSISIYKNRLYVAFRTGPTHFASTKTGMYVISTANGTDWRKEMEFFEGRDFREPFLIPIQGRLHFYCFAAGTKMAAFEPEFIRLYTSTGNGSWSAPQQVLEKGEVHWEMRNRNDKTWLTSYKGAHYALRGAATVALTLKHSTDGVNWQPMGDSGRVYFGGASECAFEFDRGGNLWGVTRLEDGDALGFGSQVVFAPKDSLGHWQIGQTDPNCYMSPKMFRHGNELYLIGRKQRGGKPFGRASSTRTMRHQRIVNWVGFSLSPKTTALYRINQEKRSVEWVMDLPGNGDTSFPSLIRLDRDRFLLANYTSPIHKRKNRSWLSGQLHETGIYLMLIEFR